jgi:hypothetical protein
MICSAQYFSSSPSAAPHNGRKDEQRSETPCIEKKLLINSALCVSMHKPTSLVRSSSTCPPGARLESPDSVVCMSWISTKSLCADVVAAVGVRGGVIAWDMSAMHFASGEIILVFLLVSSCM